MNTTIIDRGNLQYYESLLLPEAAQMIRSGTPIFALGAVENGAACGALAGGPRQGKFEISSFYVARERRNQGAGSALLDELVRIASLQEELREISCLFTNLNVEQERLAAFLKKHGFEDRTDEAGSLMALPLETAGRRMSKR